MWFKSTGPSVSITINQEAPSASTSSSQLNAAGNNSLEVNPFAPAKDAPFVNPFAPE